MLPMHEVRCPYCGEPTSLVVDDASGDQSYVEDCTVCCRPMIVSVGIDAQAGIAVSVRREDDA